MSSGPDAEDAYEAALRAADALFTRPAPAQPAAPVNSPSAAAPAAPETMPSPAGSTAPERGGRILPVIDEAPSPQFAALEAAYAPKRRGRKPGSKNKPKIKPEIKPETDFPKSPAQALYARVPPPVEMVDQDEAVTVDVAPASPAQRPAIQALEAISIGNVPRSPKRVGRVSERVKPGEGWKRRRLPRICW